MKMLAAFVLILLGLLGAVAIAAQAQTLEPVAASGSGLWPLVIVAIVAAAGVGLYLWHKRNPKGADAAMLKAKDDASELAHKVAEALATMTKTVREQAMVIASAPVQATINGGATGQGAVQAAPAPIPTPQNAPESTNAPAPAPAPQSAPAVAPAGDGDEAAWSLAMSAGVTKAQWDKWQAGRAPKA